jgi:hypothetical protein
VSLWQSNSWNSKVALHSWFEFQFVRPLNYQIAQFYFEIFVILNCHELCFGVDITKPMLFV